MFPTLLFPNYSFKVRETNGKNYIFDDVRRKYVALTPEEWVRQHLIQYFMQELGYSRLLMGVEMVVPLNGMPKRCDVVLWNKQQQTVLLAECKAPKIVLRQAAFEQTARYNLLLKVRYCLITNGLQMYCYRLDYENNSYTFLNQLPSLEELLFG